MPKYNVHLHQYVEEVASLAIEAETPEAALALARDRVRGGEPLVWKGVGMVDRAPYAVTLPSVEIGETEQIVWERRPSITRPLSNTAADT